MIRKPGRLTVAEAAFLTGLTRQAVYGWIRKAEDGDLDGLHVWESDDGTIELDATEVMRVRDIMRDRRNNKTRR